MKTFPYIQDSGHGWVRVPRTVLQEAGCESNISKYSFQKGNNVFLEEDVDMGIFVESRAKLGLETKFAPYTNKSRPSRIRNYQVFQASDNAAPALQPGADYLKSVEGE